MKNILFIFGTRPEAIKMAPIIIEFQKYSKIFNTQICVTGQHRKMLDQVLSFFNIIPNFDLNLMKPNQNLYDLTSTIIKELKSVLETVKPDFVFIHGDTTTTLSASIASYYFGAKLCHVEAGLRTYNKLSPFPEEMNRQVASKFSDIHFAPTKKAKNNLIIENIDPDSILVTGNSVIDALLIGIKKIKNTKSKTVKELEEKIGSMNLILVTAHRRENHGNKFLNICNALKQIAQRGENIIIVFPVHPNPNILEPAYKILSKNKNILLIEPLNYQNFIWLIDKSKIIISDSGGIQEEAPTLGKPVLVLRESTERPEAVESGTVVLVGTEEQNIVENTLTIINDEKKLNKFSKLKNPYGDGKTSKRIVNYIKNYKNES